MVEKAKSKRRPACLCKIEEEVIMKSREEKDSGVVIQDAATPEQHIS